MKEESTRKLLVSSSPHVGSNLTTEKIMLHVIIALSFCLIAGVVIFGVYSLLTVALCVASSVCGETLYNLIRKRPNTVKDLSAVVTGMILGLNLPPTVPFYVPIAGGFVAIMFVKMLFGGLGRNFANPAATARVFLLLSWSTQMMEYIRPIDYASGALTVKDFFVGFVDNAAYVTSATPLADVKSAAGTGNVEVNLLDMFLGNIPGTIGEVCAVAIIAAAIYLIAFKIIDWKIPLTYFAGIALFSLIFYKNGWNFVLPNLLGGGVLFAGVFMLTDYATSPNTRAGTIIFAAGAALLTILIRRYGGMNEGASFAILLMNLLVPLIDKACKPHPFGYRKPPKVKKEKKEAAL